MGQGNMSLVGKEVLLGWTTGVMLFAGWSDDEGFINLAKK